MMLFRLTRPEQIFTVLTHVFGIIAVVLFYRGQSDQGFIFLILGFTCVSLYCGYTLVAIREAQRRSDAAIVKLEAMRDETLKARRCACD